MFICKGPPATPFGGLQSRDTGLFPIRHNHHEVLVSHHQEQLVL